MSNAIQTYSNHYSTTSTGPTMAPASLPQRRDCYAGHVDVFNDWLSEHGYTSIADGVRDYFIEMNRERTYKTGTIRMKQQAIKNRLRLMAYRAPRETKEQIAEFLDMLKQDPATKPPKQASHAVTENKVLSQSEYAKLLQSGITPRQRCFIEFLTTTGCRVAELAGIRPQDCETEGEVTYITVTGKGNKTRRVIISKRLYERIQGTFTGSGWLFETSGGKPYRTSYISTQIARCTKRATGRRLSAHKLRHTFATWKIKEHPGRIKAISVYLGHSSTATTENYYIHDELTPADLLGPEVLS